MADCTLNQRIEELRKLVNKYPEEFKTIAKTATIKAIEKATEMTPPTSDGIGGTNTRTGELKQHWETDSKKDPERMGDDYVTHLNNDKNYASYVNDGHELKKHFVPGLVINPYSGLLEMNPNGEGGIMVGTKTSYVEGIFMKEAAIEEYKKSVKRQSKKLFNSLRRNG